MGEGNLPGQEYHRLLLFITEIQKIICQQMGLNLLFACGQFLKSEMFLTILFSFIISFLERIYQPFHSHLSCKIYSLFSSLLSHYTCPYQPSYFSVFVFLIFSNISVFIFNFLLYSTGKPGMERRASSMNIIL